jgi:hypothetical protein
MAGESERPRRTRQELNSTIAEQARRKVQQRVNEGENCPENHARDAKRKQDEPKQWKKDECSDGQRPAKRQQQAKADDDEEQLHGFSLRRHLKPSIVETEHKSFPSRR